MSGKHAKDKDIESISGDLMDGRGPFEPLIPAEPKPEPPKEPSK